MKLPDFVLILMVITFFPFLEGLLARSPQWRSLADATEYGFAKALVWRQDGNITRELAFLERFFLMLTVLYGALLAVVILLFKARYVFAWASLAFLVSFIAWFSFRWTYRHRDVMQHLAPIAGLSLIIPLLFLWLNSVPHKTGVMRQIQWALQFVSYTPVEIAVGLFAMVAGILLGYRLFVWIASGPLAYGVLVALKGSGSGSAWMAQRLNRNLLFEASAVIQFAGLAYFLWLAVR